MPRIVDHDVRRRQICDVLLDVVAEAGVTAATIREIAERSGWSTGVIGHYFKNRQDLLLGGLRRAAELIGEHNMRVLTTLEGLMVVVPDSEALHLNVARAYGAFGFLFMEDHMEQALVDDFLSGAVIGDPALCSERLPKLARELEADEIMISSLVPSLEKRLAALEHLAELLA